MAAQDLHEHVIEPLAWLSALQQRDLRLPAPVDARLILDAVPIVAKVERGQYLLALHAIVAASE